MTSIVLSVPASRVRPAMAAAPSPRLRLTSRGRVVFGTLAVVPVLAGVLFMGAGAPGAVAGGEIPLDTFSFVSVAPGQTLWQLAESLAPAADPRDVISEIMDLNQLQSAAVTPGQRLAIPQKYAG